MDRRTFLGTLGGPTLVLPGIAGCSLEMGDGPRSDAADGRRVAPGPTAAETVWATTLYGGPVTVVDGHLVCQGGVTGPAVYALDPETGDYRWRYGETGGYTAYSDPAVADALYFGRGDDVTGSGWGDLYALEFDGSERWRLEAGGVYRPPVIDEGVVYVGTDDGFVRAVDGGTGEVLWRTGAVSSDVARYPTVHAAVDTAPTAGDAFRSTTVLAAGAGVVALDGTDGTVRWRAGDVRRKFDDLVVAGGGVYATAYDTVVGITNRTVQWRVPMTAWIEGVAGGNLVLDDGDGVTALDLATGDERWRVATSDEADYALYDGDVYLADDRLVAVSAADGTELWATGRGNGSWRSPAVTTAGPSKGATVVAVGGPDRLVAVDLDGERRWEATLGVEVEGFLVDEYVYVEFQNGIRAVDPW